MYFNDSLSVLGNYESCNHWKQEFEVGKYKVYLSSVLDNPQWSTKICFTEDNTIIFPKVKQVKMKGIFLDNLWKRSIKSCKDTYIIHWPDGSSVSIYVINSIINILEDMLKRNIKVNICCIGGHGRTGTVLACLICKLEGITPNEAIYRVWSEYCKKAIENKNQINMVFDYYNNLTIDTREKDLRINNVLNSGLGKYYDHLGKEELDDDI